MQRKENFLLDNPDILFHLENKINLVELFDLISDEVKENAGVNTPEEMKTMCLELLKSFGEVVGSEIAPNAKKVATQDLKLDENGDVHFPEAISSNVKKLVEVGVAGIGVSPEFGGIGIPLCYEIPAIELLHRACPSTTLNVTWYGAIARVLEQIASDEIKKEFIPKLASGEFSGSMALTEPDAGSDLANIRTYGVKQADGSWKLFGSKRFISNGQSEVCLAIAKNKKGEHGLGSINLFLCPRHVNGKKNYSVTKLEEKPGLHGSATCELQFDGAYALQIGEDGRGFHYMLQLMNEARVAVAVQALGMMEAIFRVAKDYTQQRKSWGKPIAEHELIAEKLLDLETELYAARSLCYQSCQALAYSNLAEKKLKDKTLSATVAQEIESKKARYDRKLRRWTPLVKYWLCERAVSFARTCLQLHGGYGFTTEYSPEWWLRESLILPVYEGTSQIQALMCMKDTMKEIIRNPAKFIEVALGTQMQTISERDPLRRSVAKLRQISNSSLITLIFKLLKENARSNFSKVKPNDIRTVLKRLTKELIRFDNLSLAMLHAERVCEMKALVSMGESLVKDVKIDLSRKWIAERFLHKAVLRMQYLQSEIESDDEVLLARIASYQKGSASAGATA